jgi:hypothetical protein
VVNVLLQIKTAEWQILWFPDTDREFWPYLCRFAGISAGMSGIFKIMPQISLRPVVNFFLKIFFSKGPKEKEINLYCLLVYACSVLGLELYPGSYARKPWQNNSSL